MNPEVRIKELEDELKETKKTVNQLIQILSNATTKDGLDGNNSDSNKKLEDFMERMEERAKKQEDVENILLEKIRGQEEIMTEMRKTVNGTNLEIGMIQKQMLLLQKAVENVEENRTVVEETMKRIPQMEAVLRETSNSLNEINEKQEKLHEYVDSKDSIFNKRKLNEMKKIEEELRKKVESLLIGNLVPLKDRVKMENSQIVFENGISLNFEEFHAMIENFQKSTLNSKKSHHALSVLEDPMWIVTPKVYNVECRNSSCKRMIPLVHNIREDGVSVKCIYCCNLTPLGSPKQGFEWVYPEPCHHYQQVKYDEYPEGGKCLVCGGNVISISCNIDDWARIPRRILH